jgi:hypothetical protein
MIMHPAKMQLKEYFVNELFFRAQTKFFDAAQSIDFRLKPADLEIEVSLGQNAENQNEKMCHRTSFSICFQYRPGWILRP